MTETWLSAQGDEAKTAELAPSGFDVKSFPRQSRSLVDSPQLFHCKIYFLYTTCMYTIYPV